MTDSPRDHTATLQADDNDGYFDESQYSDAQDDRYIRGRDLSPSRRPGRGSRANSIRDKRSDSRASSQGGTRIGNAEFSPTFERTVVAMETAAVAKDTRGNMPRSDR